MMVVPFWQPAACNCLFEFVYVFVDTTNKLSLSLSLYTVVIEKNGCVQFLPRQLISILDKKIAEVSGEARKASFLLSEIPDVGAAFQRCYFTRYLISCHV